MDLHNLQLILEKNKTLTLQEFIKTCKITKDQLIDIVCKEELNNLYSKYGKVSSLPFKSAVSELPFGPATLNRRKKDGLPPLYSQDKPKTPIYYPIREIAVYHYINSHPIIVGEASFSKLFKNAYLI